MEITEKIVIKLSSGIIKGVTDNIAPIVTVAVDNAVQRYTVAKARKEALSLLLSAGDFCRKLNQRHGEIDGVNVTYTFDLELVTAFRKLQQAAEEYQTRLETHEF